MNQAALRDLLTRRLELVQRLSQATGVLQKLLQMRAGAEMDVQRCEIGLERGPDADLARDLLESRGRVDECDDGLERCEAEIADLETILAETDREIETAARA